MGTNEIKKKNNNISRVKDIKNFEAKKSTKITAKKILQKYKNMKRPKITFLLNEEDFETIAYENEPQENLFKKESILKAANKVLDFEEFKKQQEEAINNFNEKLLNKNKRRAIEKEEQLIEIIKVPKKRKQQKDKAAQIAAKKSRKSKKNIRLTTDDKNDFKIARSAFDKLKTDASSVPCAEEILDKKLLLKLKNQSMQKTIFLKNL